MSRWAERFAAQSRTPDTVDNVDTVTGEPNSVLPELHSVAQCQNRHDTLTGTQEHPKAAEILGFLPTAPDSVNKVNNVTLGMEEGARGAGKRAKKVSTTVLTLPDTVEPESTFAPATAQDTVDTVDTVSERAAPVDDGAGLPRVWAEGFGRLDPERPPADVPPQRWLHFVDDVGSFLDGGFAGQAAALGWGPYDLFGADADRPFARVDKAGLLWLLRGDRLVALTANAAIIETSTGTRQTYRRKPNEPGRVLAWELAP